MKGEGKQKKGKAIQIASLWGVVFARLKEERKVLLLLLLLHLAATAC
jgi:hypothetical protein